MALNLFHLAVHLKININSYTFESQIIQFSPSQLEAIEITNQTKILMMSPCQIFPPLWADDPMIHYV